MKITVTPDVFKLAQVFTISRGSRTEAKVLTVRVEDGDHVGWGECVPYARYDETLESVTAEIEALQQRYKDTHQGRPPTGPFARDPAWLRGMIEGEPRQRDIGEMRSR